MCLTCGCMRAHLDMGPAHIRYEDLKAAADESGNSVPETIKIFEETLSRDKREHADEYAGS
jgi:hypothetical protein